MRLIHRCVASSLLAVLLTNGLSVALCADEPATDDPQTQVTGDLVPRWDTQAILDTSRDHVRHFVHDESVVLIQSSSGLVTAMNSENGRRLWARQVGNNDEPSMPAGTSKQHALVVTGPMAHALNKFTGDEQFTYRLPRQPSVGPVVSEGSFFVPLMGGSVAGFSFSTLEYREKFGELPGGVARPMAWRFVANESIRQQPEVGAGVVVFATEKGNIHGVHASGTNGGHSLYQLFVRKRIVVPLAIARTPDDEFLLFATSDDIVTCVKLFNGRTMWSYPMGRAVEDRMVVVGDNIYLITEGEGLSSLSLTRGRPGSTPRGPWFVPDIQAVAAVSATRVYGVDNTMHLVIIDRETSAVQKRIPLGEATKVFSNSLTDRVYLYTSSGRIRCFAEEGSDFATYHQRPERQPVMPEIPDKDPIEVAPEDDSF